ncbi:nitric oxide synthase [Pseudomonas sp. BGM005]|nr:nitric oxide synthase [Pseudomonas sp. BG5]
MIIFGTESGNAEMAADDVAATFSERGFETKVISMEDVSVANLALMANVVVITSTYGEGELPETTAPFIEALQQSTPDLSALNFAAFGLGDSTYKKYNNAIDVVVNHLVDLGARQVGVTGRHDAASGISVTTVATEWAKATYI